MLHAIERSCEGVQMPLQRLETLLHSPVNYIIIPIFALANAGLVLSGFELQSLTTAVTSGVILGLLVGKSVGISLFAWISVKLGLAVLPRHVSWTHVVGVAFLGGIGFTMSLFVSDLAFRGTVLGEEAKLGILVGSLLAGVIGALLILRVRTSGRTTEEEG
jgi:NhaA family Na+:H+ antiporter